MSKKKAAVAAKKADNNNAVNTACAADAKTAGCGDKQVGSGLLRCLQEYKQAHKEFTFSAECKAAKQKRQENQKSKKEDHKQ